MHLISILVVAAMAAVLIPEAVSGECSYDKAASTKLTTSKKWIDDSIARHNEYRLKHGVCPLTFNQKLSEIAQAYANKLASTGGFKHSGTRCLGENLAEKGSTADFQIESNFAVDGWYDEIKDYDFKSGKATRAAMVGHLTQVLWKESREVGIAFAKYTKGGWTKFVVVANYYPQGNFVGENPKNVFEAGRPLPGECKDAKSPNSVHPGSGNVNEDGNEHAPGLKSRSKQPQPSSSAANWNRLPVLSFWIAATVSLAIAS